MAMTQVVSENSKAVRRFVEGSDGENEEQVRQGARELMQENVRLRSILRALHRAEMGEGARIELSQGDECLNVVVCCATRTESSLLEAVVEGMRWIFTDVLTGPVTVTGTEAERGGEGGPGGG